MTAAHIRLTAVGSTLALVITSHSAVRLCAENRSAGEAKVADNVSVLNDPLAALGRAWAAPDALGLSF